jgi:hypothetical protein
MDMAEKGIDLIHNLRYLLAGFYVLTDMAGILFCALILFLILKTAKVYARYKDIFIIYAYISLIAIAGNILNFLVLYSIGLDKLTNINEVFLIGLNAFFTYDGVGKLLYSLSALVNPFALLFFVYLAIAVASVFKTGLLKSCCISFALFIVIKIVPVLLSLFINI